LTFRNGSVYRKGKRSGPVSYFKEDLRMPFRLVLDKGKCSGCEECLEACSVKVFEMKDGKSLPVREDACIGCKGCIDACKEKAITIDDIQPEMSEIARMLLRGILSD
jgi:NAD-dependent dihydropyrimidine dehydrogenase PreA subunit